jgi:hypothetical protein
MKRFEAILGFIIAALILGALFFMGSKDSLNMDELAPLIRVAIPVVVIISIPLIITCIVVVVVKMVSAGVSVIMPPPKKRKF